MPEDLTAPKQSFELDDLSRNILKELRKNSRVAAAEIGRRVGLSAPAVAERISRMEEQGIIKGYKTIVDYDKLGLTVRVFLTFRSKTLRHAEMIRMADMTPQIIEWYTITGDNCMLLKIAVASTRELEKVIERFAEFGETTTSIILTEKELGEPDTKMRELNGVGWNNIS